MKIERHIIWDMMPPLELQGEVYGRLLVLKRADNKDKHSGWACLCKCGTKKTVCSTSLRRGFTKSCGCLAREVHRKLQTTHNMSRTRFYKIWDGVFQRSHNPNSPAFRNYGGRGIVCSWNSFKDFKKDMYTSYLSHVRRYGEKDTTIERKNNESNYSKENCRWSTRLEQGRNKRTNVNITYNGKTKTITEWGRLKKLDPTTISKRIKSGWSIEKSLNTKTKIHDYRIPLLPRAANGDGL